ncbi:MAG: DUF2058 family protein [Thermodesulfobacteriota bacterium]|nr:DUF2058 family protein [Thermodesulfobacteriota bacterium]
MGNPFQDQLLKAGLVNKKQVKKAKHKQRINRQQNRNSGPTEAVNKARQEQISQANRNRDLNQQRAEENRQREQRAQAKQLIKTNRLARDDSGEPYHFVEQNKIKRIFVSTEMTDQLSRGQLAIVKLGNNYEVVPAKAARQIASRDKEALIVFHDGPEEAHT